MKEITRIHLAKVAYDIEIDAKKDIQKYISALETYASDGELLSDIEIRITELLAERGVAAGGVITKDDVAAVRAQLGEPSDFADEDVARQSEVAEEPRSVYRDEGTAVLGGVLAGFAKFFGIDALWVRLGFIVLLFASFGTALLLYIILWFIIPPARTAADKLRMSGRAVTLASIKELGGTEEQRNQRAQAMRRTLSGLIGGLLVALAIAGLIVIVVTVFGVNEWRGVVVPGSDLESWWFMTATGLFVLSGLLFSTLCFLLASAVFRRQWSKRIGIATVAIVTLGLVSFTSGVATGYIGVESEREKLEAAMVETKVEFPAEFREVKRLLVSAHTISSDDDYGYSELQIQYRVDTRRAPRYELTALPDIKPDIKVADGQARIVLKSSVAQQRAYGWVKPQLVIYGPALDEVHVEQGRFEYIAEIPKGQDGLKVVTLAATQAIVSGTFATLEVHGAGQVDATMSAVTNLVATTEAGASVQAGVVRSLSVMQPDVCPADTWMRDEPRHNQVAVRGISGGDFKYNNAKRDVGSVAGACGQVLVGDDNEEYDL